MASKREWMMGKTLGKTTEASAKYSYKICTSLSVVVYFTKVAITDRTNTCRTVTYRLVKTCVMYSFEMTTKAYSTRQLLASDWTTMYLSGVVS